MFTFAGSPGMLGSTRLPAGMPAFSRFGQVSELDAYVPIEDGWFVGLVDVVGSTAAIAAGRYKAVNTAGAAAISAVCNALGTSEVLYAFQGDGSTVVVPPEDEAAARDALAATATFAAEELGLELRAAFIPIGDIRAAGHDVKVARFAVSGNVSSTLFSGGGLAFADREVKLGRYRIAPAPAGAMPDLSGLSCRFERLPSRNGVVLSLIERRVPGGSAEAYRDAVAGIVQLVEAAGARANPVSEGALRPSLEPASLTLERAVGGAARRVAGRPGRLAIALKNLLHRAALAVGHAVAPPGLIRYVANIVMNSDYRKYDDGLRATLDCSPAEADAIEGRLEAARRAGILTYGTHRQEAALMTCFTPSRERDDHIHFVDGAGGGYAVAASRLKVAIASPGAGVPDRAGEPGQP